MALAKKLYSCMMAVVYYGMEEEGPEVLTSKLRDLAITLYPSWVADKTLVLKFAQDYLSKQDYIRFKCWDEGPMTCSVLMHLDDACHCIIVRLS